MSFVLGAEPSLSSVSMGIAPPSSTLSGSDSPQSSEGRFRLFFYALLFVGENGAGITRSSSQNSNLLNWTTCVHRAGGG